MTMTAALVLVVTLTLFAAVVAELTRTLRGDGYGRPRRADSDAGDWGPAATGLPSRPYRD